MKLDARALPLLKTFGLRAENAGVCLGSNRWSGSGPTIASINPANETLRTFGECERGGRRCRDRSGIRGVASVAFCACAATG